MSELEEVRMDRPVDGIKKHSVRYNAHNEQQAKLIKSIYICNTLYNAIGKPESITVAVRPVKQLQPSEEASLSRAIAILLLTLLGDNYEKCSKMGRYYYNLLLIIMDNDNYGRLQYFRRYERRHTSGNEAG